MHPGALRALEFDRIVSVVTGLAVTPTGRAQLARLTPMTDASAVARAQRATTEGTRFLADHPGFPLRAPSDLDRIIAALGVEGRALEPLRLLRPGRLSRVHRADARRRAQGRSVVPAAEQPGRDGRVVQGRDRRCPPEDRAVRRSGRQRQPGARLHSRPAAQAEGAPADSRSTRFCGAARRRSISRSRSSPTGTAVMS